MYELITMFVFFGATFVTGYFLIRRVPSLLHTPLMSMTNAISAVTIIGAVLIFAVKTDLVEGVLGSVAVVTAMFNVVGGFVITHRMLKLFRKAKK
jgi:H+-translocating NAD(P) transhydrogenase subunit alpha